jgi:hypothetical protein
VWAKFLQLSSLREVGETGPKQLSWQAIQAWQNVTHSSLEEWELATILKLDREYILSKLSKTEDTSEDVQEEG